MLRSTQLPAVASPGRACENCARAKAKCEPQHGEPTNICARFDTVYPWLWFRSADYPVGVSV